MEKACGCGDGSCIEKVSSLAKFRDNAELRQKELCNNQPNNIN